MQKRQESVLSRHLYKQYPKANLQNGKSIMSQCHYNKNAGEDKKCHIRLFTIKKTDGG